MDTVSMAWDVGALVHTLDKRPRGVDMSTENQLLDSFAPFVPPAEVTANRPALLQRPATIQDHAGRIMVWSLPGIILPARQVCYFPSINIVSRAP